MTVETRTVPKAGLLALRLAGALITGGGQLADDAAETIAQATVSRRVRERLNDAWRAMQADELVVQVDGVWYAPNLPDLGAWLADALEAREDLGLPLNPTIPRARVAA